MLKYNSLNSDTAEAHQLDAEDMAALCVTCQAMWAIGILAAVPLVIAAVLWSVGS